MNIQINAQTISRKKPSVHALKMELKKCPSSLRELICLCVEELVESQHARIHNSSDTALSEEEMNTMAQAGKIAFGVDYNGTPADLNQAINIALQSYTDGLYRVFLNGQEIQGLDSALSLTESDTLTFIRLAMLTGTSWLR